jgi:hypothetical protein
LESKGIHIILGMDWLSKHKVLIDCAKKSVKLTTPEGMELQFVVEPVVTAKGVASQGPEVSVVCDFPNVFPKELLGCHPTVTSSL